MAQPPVTHDIWLAAKSASVAWKIQASHVEPHQKERPSVSTSYLWLSLAFLLATIASQATKPWQQVLKSCGESQGQLWMINSARSTDWENHTLLP